MKFTWGVQGGREEGQAAACQASHVGKPVCGFQLNIFSPQCAGSAARERQRLIYLMTALISSGGTGWQRGSFVNTLPMNPWGSIYLFTL